MPRTVRVVVKMTPDEVADLDAARHGETRPGFVRRLVREAGTTSHPTKPAVADETEALTILSMMARDGSTTAAVALARLMLDREAARPPLSRGHELRARVDQLARRRAEQASS